MHPDILRALAEARRADLHQPARACRADTSRHVERPLGRQYARPFLEVLRSQLAVALRVDRRRKQDPEWRFPLRTDSGADPSAT
jgi:hypothetical protein